MLLSDHQAVGAAGANVAQSLLTSSRLLWLRGMVHANPPLSHGHDGEEDLVDRSPTTPGVTHRLVGKRTERGRRAREAHRDRSCALHRAGKAVYGRRAGQRRRGGRDGEEPCSGVRYRMDVLWDCFVKTRLPGINRIGGVGELAVASGGSEGRGESRVGEAIDEPNRWRGADGSFLAV
jgi:hypothetical protein